MTGATGTVGREVCRALVAREVDVRVGVRGSSDVEALPLAVTDRVALDFAEAISPALFEDVDALFFMTPLIDDQVRASSRLLRAAETAGVPHVIRLSSRSAGWDRESVLRAWHREVEDMVQRSRMSSVVLRPCSFFQNFITHQRRAIREMSAVIVPQGNGLIPYVDALDIGEAAAICLCDASSHDGATYVLTGGRAYGVKGVAAEIGRVIGKPVVFIDIDESQARSTMEQLGYPPWLIEAGLAVFAHARAGGEAEVDPTLTRLLGRPATSLSEFVERNRDAWSGTGSSP